MTESDARQRYAPSRAVDQFDDGAVDPGPLSTAMVYGLLVRLFDEPDEQLYEALVDGSLCAELAALCAESDVDVDPPALETGDDAATLRARFNDIFEVGVPKPPVPLYESSHREDATWNELNVDLARAYEHYGLEIDESNREDHDHLRIQLEFASYLARREAAGYDDAKLARRDFIDRHLSTFADHLSSAVDREPNTDVYAEITHFLDAFVNADFRALETDIETNNLETSIDAGGTQQGEKP